MFFQNHSAIFLLLIVFTISSLSLAQNYTLKKCCNNEEGLKRTVLNSSEIYTCSSEFENHVLPLRIRENVNFGMPDTCESESCIDKLTDDSKIIELYCNQTEKTPAKKLPTIAKCCPFYMLYNETTKSCDYDDNSDEDLIFDTTADIYNLRFGSPICQNKALVDHVIHEDFHIVNGTLILNNFRKFKNGTYCIDKTRRQSKVIVRSCEFIKETCNMMTCLPKCCASGKMFQLNSNNRPMCLNAFNVTFKPKFDFGNDEDKDKLKKIALLGRPTCKYNNYLQKEFILYSNATLYFSTYLDPLLSTYCLENFDLPTVKGLIAIICFPPPDVGLHNFYYLVGLLISIIFLAITLTIYFFLPELQNLHGRTVMSHTASLLASFICLAIVKQPSTSYGPYVCLMLSYGILFTFLVAFSWLNVMCFDIWYTFGVVQAQGIRKRGEIKRFLLYSLYAYGLPLIFTGIAMYVDVFAKVPEEYKPKFGTDSCWFNTGKNRSYLPYTIFFCIPVAILIACNIVLFILTVRHCIKVRRDIQRMQHVDSPKKRRFFTDKATFVMNVKLFMVMGVSWVFEIISMYIREPFWLWQTLDSINVLQGFWIFCIFVLKNNVWKAIRKKLGHVAPREGSQTNSSMLSAKNSVISTTSVKVNCVNNKMEGNDLIRKNIGGSNNRKNSLDPMLKK